jgi:bifunctional DNase/RNase
MNAHYSVELKGIVPTPAGAGIFLSHGDKMITIFVDSLVAASILQAMEGETPERPQTHDLMVSVFQGLGIHMTAGVITDFADETFFAKLHLLQENELGKEMVEIDARPSDCIALAVRLDAPLYVAQSVWDAAEDMSGVYYTLKNLES